MMKKYGKYIIALIVILVIMITICFIPIGINRFIPIIENQVAAELGVNIHIDKLVLRIGPKLKAKAPIMHVLYKDGQKFAQFDTVKFYISWSTLINHKPIISAIDSKNMTVRVNSNDKELSNFINKIFERKFKDNPNIHLSTYSITYSNNNNNDKYLFEGNDLDIKKIITHENYKISTKGDFSINDKKYINYDFSFAPNVKFTETDKKYDLSEYFSLVKELDFHSDVIADIKLKEGAADTIKSYGYINIDNISVLDPAKKAPKSFIYLTFLGDNTSILSNIYTSQDKKVYVEGKVNNSQKPVIDIKVKAEEIKLSDLFPKLKFFMDFSHLKNLKSVDGLITANFALKGDLNKIKSSGFLKVINANIKSDGLQVDKINADIDFSNNVINIINGIGYVNNSPIIAKGTIDKDINLELVMNKVELKHLLPQSIGIKNGLISVVANITGTLKNVIHKEIVQIERLDIDNDNYKLTIDSLKIDTNKNNTAYINNILCSNSYTQPVKIPSMKLYIEKDKVKLPETNIFMANSKLTAAGEILNYNNKDFTFNTNLKGFVHSKDVNCLNCFSARYPLNIIFNGNKLVQNIYSQVLLEQANVLDEPSLINLAAKLEKNIIKIEDLSINSTNGKFTDDAKQNLKGIKKAVISGSIENIQAPIAKNLRVFIPQYMNIHILDTIAQLKGDLFINGDIKNPEFVGSINVQNLFNQAIQLSLSNCTAEFNKNIAVINAPLVKIADSSMSVNANVSTNYSDVLDIKNINIKSKYLNTDTILMYKDNPIIKNTQINIQDGKFYSERLLADIYGESVYLTSLNSDIKLYNNILSLKNITAEGYNGKFAGNLNFNLKDESFESNIMGRGVSASPIFDIISKRKDTISGSMDFDSTLKGEISSKNSLEGNIKFIIHNGRMSTLGKIEHLLYAQNVIADNMLRTSLSIITKALTAKDTGLFKYLRGEVQMQNGAADIKMLQSQGPSMAMFIKGIYYPETDYAKLTVLGRLSDEIIAGLGAFGDFSLNKLLIMLTGEENKYNVNIEDVEKIPQLPMKNTKEFRAIINGIIDKPSSVQQFNWISYSQKSMRQKDMPSSNEKVPAFIENLP